MLLPKRILTGSTDKFIKIFTEKEGKLILTDTLQESDGSVRDVSWANNTGLLNEMVAIGSEAKTATIYR